MPVDIIYLDDGVGAMLRGTEIVTGKDITSANEEMFSTPDRTQKYLYGIADWTGITDYCVSISDLERAIYQNVNASKYLPEAFLIGIVAENDIAFGLSRMFGVFLETYGLKWNVKVFRDMTDTEKWIKKGAKEFFGLDLKFIESMCVTP